MKESSGMFVDFKYCFDSWLIFWTFQSGPESPLPIEGTPCKRLKHEDVTLILMSQQNDEEVPVSEDNVKGDGERSKKGDLVLLAS